MKLKSLSTSMKWETLNNHQQDLSRYNSTVIELIDVVLRETEAPENEDSIMNLLIGLKEYVVSRSDSLDDQVEGLFKTFIIGEAEE